MYFIGADPDTHTPAIAIVHEDGWLAAVYCIKSKAGKGEQAVLHLLDAWGAFLQKDMIPRNNLVAYAVESQELVYAAKSGKNPRSVALLGSVSGIMLLTFKILNPAARSFFPKPQAWKGNVPKQIHHARTFKALGIECNKAGSQKDGYCYPAKPLDIIGIETVNKGDWKHVGDAVALACWARQQHNAAKQREEFTHGHAEQRQTQRRGSRPVARGLQKPL